MAQDRLTSAYPIRRIVKTWWPLAASWLLMALELPSISAVVARLDHPEINLAAWGGVVFPIALLVEAPIIMLLAASTALSKDWASYLKIRRFMIAAGGVLTALHLAVAFTPLFDFVVLRIIGAPPEILEPARIGLRLMTPWTWSIAYRRFNQGVLIRLGHSDAVGIGTFIRLMADLTVLGTGLVLRQYPGTMVAGTAVALGVVSEAIYAGIRVRPVLRLELRFAPSVQPAMEWRQFFEFYIPLAMTSLITLLINPLGSAAISRMPQALGSLAVWPVVSGLVFMLRSMGVAYNEVVVALLDEPGASASLRRFAWILAGTSTTVMILLAASPLASFWFLTFSALEPALAELARTAVWFALPLPAMNVAQSWLQGVLLNAKTTRPITEAVVVFISASSICLLAGVLWSGAPGLYIGWLAFSVGGIAQSIWLWKRSRTAIHALDENRGEFDSGEQA
ncbi:MAG: hypothetical protein JXA97_04225 [Anaerolineales bacterium]|nr:hypothetical protein [Anaerolineales bacterium]